MCSVLLKQRAGLQGLSGRAAPEDVVMETSQLLVHDLESPSLEAPILHGEQFGAQVVDPQHVGAGVVGTPVVSLKEKRRH